MLPASLLLEKAQRDLGQRSLIDFIQAVAPWFRLEEVHLVIATYLEALANGELDRLMVFMPPRTGKSLMASVFLPAWYLGRFPWRKVMAVSYQSELATGFGRDVRGIVRGEDFQQIFPGVVLSADNRAAGRWSVLPPPGAASRQVGTYWAAGIKGGIAGKGWHLGVIDDPMSEQDATSTVAKDSVWEWYPQGFYTRRQPEQNAMVVMMTRWAKDDLAGRLLEKAKNEPEADKFTVLNIPAILDRGSAVLINKLAAAHGALGEDRKELKEGGSFSPRRWKKSELLRTKGNVTSRSWTALYLGKPVEDEGNILKRKWWRRWPYAKAPDIEYMLQCYDTAFEDGEENDFSARTTWGIFKYSDTGDPKDAKHHCILLERWKARVQAVDLRQLALAAYKEYKPDRILIEKRASGIQLIQELRRAYVPASSWLPPGGSRYSKGKVPRAHAASVPLELGAVWYMPRNWADDVIDECADFPYGQHEDLADTVTMALIYLRRHFWLDVPGEDEDDDPKVKSIRQEKEEAGDSFGARYERPGNRRIYG